MKMRSLEWEDRWWMGLKEGEGAGAGAGVGPVSGAILGRRRIALRYPTIVI